MNAMSRGGMSEQQKKTIAIVAFAVVAVGILVYQLRDILFDTVPAPPPAAVIITNPAQKPVSSAGAKVSSPPGFAPAGTTGAGEARKVGTASTLLDPTLHMDAMLITESLVYTGKGRNIFAAGPTVLDAPIAVQHARNPLPQPIVPVRIADTGPPPTPPINIKFFGTASRGPGDRSAFLLHGDDVFLARAGDIVDRRYKVISITANSIVIEDLPNNNRQTLPLQAN
jgi:hypothetical protein